MVDYKAELERRRERGRLAQGAFRARQAQARQRMLEENAQLKKAIEDIVREVQADDRPELRHRIQEAAELAGLGADGSKTNDDHIPAKNAIFSRIHRDPYQHAGGLQRGPDTVLPFLGSGAFTFAGCLFWHLAGRVEGEAASSSSSSSNNSSPGQPVPLQIMAFFSRLASLQHIEPAQWIPLIEARLAVACHQAVPVAPSPEDLLSPLHEGGATVRWSASNWLSPLSAEQRIRTAVGDDVFAVLASPMLDRWGAEVKRMNQEPEQAYGRRVTRSRSEIIDGFMDTLAESYVCFGDGPRWHSETFDTALKSWCASVIGQY